MFVYNEIEGLKWDDEFEIPIFSIGGPLYNIHFLYLFSETFYNKSQYIDIRDLTNCSKFPFAFVEHLNTFARTPW